MPELTPIDPVTSGDARVTLPDRDALYAGISTYATDPYVAQKFTPLLVDNLAGKTLHPLGVVNGYVLACVVYAQKVTEGASGDAHVRDTMLMSFPAFVPLMFDDPDTQRLILGVWLWYCDNSGVPSGIERPRTP